MAEEAVARRHEVELYMGHADEMLQVAEHNLAQGFCSTAVNRAYYAVFFSLPTPCCLLGGYRGASTVGSLLPFASTLSGQD
jgi:hypothetical protein